MNNKKIIISIDGLSSTGKSTLAKYISKKLKYKHIDTGAMYRSIAWLAIKEKVFNSDLWNINNFIAILNKIKLRFYKDKKSNISYILLNDKNIQSKIRSIEVTKKTPLIARIPEIRKKLISIQKKMGLKKGIVVDGRDIGNCVFPKSEIKFFIKSSLEIRSYRRYKEIKKTSYENIKRYISYRDELDSIRKISPIKQSLDHIEIDNTYMTIDQQYQLIIKIINKKIFKNNEIIK